MPSFISGLNENQKKAVLHNEGPLLVLAGAGSGKTRVLTQRIARLVYEKHCSPDQILAVTFTNKAAKEMQERVAQATNPKIAEQMTLCTFHSLGVRILKEFGDKLGINKKFTIIDEHDKSTTLKGIMRAQGVRGLKNEDPDEFAHKISLAKNASLDPDSYKETNPDERKIFRVYNSYRQILLKRQTLDFDDLLLYPLELFKKFPDVITEYRKRYSFISIDEFQDTNAVQMKLALMLAAPKNNIMVVGDDDQGIYSWRGAEIENIISFANHFSNCTTVILDKNYRSTIQILNGAHAVISHNRVRKYKKIEAVAGDGDPIMHYKGDDEEDEAIWIAEKIAEHKEHTSFDYRDHAILLRTNALMRRYEEELRRKHIPYRVSGATSFYERKEIKDIIAYLRFFSNPHDELSMTRVLKVPSRGISQNCLEIVDDFAALRKMSMWDAMERHTDATNLSTEQHNKIQEFLDFYKKYDEQFKKGPLHGAIKNILDECGYFQLLEKAYKEEGDAAQRRENVEEIIHGLELFEAKFKKNKPSLADYLHELSLTLSDDEDENEKNSTNRVSILTLHKSKGLEFPVVILAGLESDILPSPRSVEEGKVEEERRLFYVGMTRAQKRLYLTYPGTKLSRGKIKKVTPCPFVREIPEEYLDGKIGEKQDMEKEQFIEDFFKQMKSKFAQQQAALDEIPGLDIYEDEY